MSNIVQKKDSLLGDYTPEDFGNLPRPPAPIICKLGQGTSQKGEPGRFNFSKPDWPSAEVLTDVVALAPRATRVLYGERFDSPSRCGSDDFNHPSPRYKEPISHSCGDCPAKMWPNEVVTKEQHEVRARLIAEIKPQRTNIPLCRESVNMIFIDERMIPFMMPFQGTALKNVYDNLINVLRYSGKRIFAQMFDMKVKRIQKNTERGPTFYYETSFENFRDITNDTYRARVAQLAGYWGAMAQDILAEQFERMDAEKDVT
jgi:hypothetical protein